jgi:hypothetical protein
MPQVAAVFRSRDFRILVATLLWVLPAALLAQPSPRVTSEIACQADSDCPAHDGLCFDPGLPTCGCNESAGRCDPNPLGCDGAGDCFGEEVCIGGHCAEPGPREGSLCNFDEDCPDWMSCRGGGCTRGVCTLESDCGPGQDCARNACAPAACAENRDCPAGFACRNRTCRAVACVADADCGGGLSVCREGACRAVECTADANCGGCAICNSQNRCQTRCDPGEGCQTLFTAELPLRVQRCAACTPDASGNCPTILIGCGREPRICDAIRKLEQVLDRRRPGLDPIRPPEPKP